MMKIILSAFVHSWREKLSALRFIVSMFIFNSVSYFLHKLQLVLTNIFKLKLVKMIRVEE